MMKRGGEQAAPLLRLDPSPIKGPPNLATGRRPFKIADEHQAALEARDEAMYIRERVERERIRSHRLRSDAQPHPAPTLIEVPYEIVLPDNEKEEEPELPAQPLAVVPANDADDIFAAVEEPDAVLDDGIAAAAHADEENAAVSDNDMDAAAAELDHLLPPQQPALLIPPPEVDEVGRRDLVEQLKVVFGGHPDDVYERLIAAKEAEMPHLHSRHPYPVQVMLNNLVEDFAALDLPQMTKEEIVAQIKGIFPHVDAGWVETEVEKGSSLDDIANFITDPNNNVPRAPKPSVKRKIPHAEVGPKSKSPKKEGRDDSLTEPFYFRQDEAYRLAAERRLCFDFPQISLWSLRHVLEAFGNNYAPTHQALTVELNRPEWKLRQVEIAFAGNSGNSKVFLLHQPLAPTQAVIGAGAAVSRLEVLKNVRRRRSGPGPASPPIPEGVGEKMECEICCDEKPLSQFRSCREGHPFCRACLTTQSKEMVFGQGAGSLSCLSDGCTAGYPRNVIDELLPPEMTSKMDERDCDQAVAAAGLSGLVKCRYCAWGVVLEASVEEDKVFRCGNDDCRRQWCRICERDWDEEHFGKKCEELEDAAAAARKALEEAMTAAIMRKCENCGLQFQKVEGCNKMTCTCGATSCYLCKEPDIHYDHFCQHPRDPGHGCTVCTSCSLWEAAAKYDEARLKAVVDANKAVTEDKENHNL